MATDAGFTASDHDGFTEAHLEVLERFRDVAVDNHLSNGNLDGSGYSPDVQHHVRGVVAADQLLNHYDLPVVLSIPTGVGDEARNVRANDTTYTFSISAFVADYDQQYGLELAQVIIGNVVNNVEENRRLESTPGAGDPVAKDAHLTSGADAVQFDFALNVRDERVHLKYGTADFVVETKRRKPVS
jgi:hypothetical protein